LAEELVRQYSTQKDGPADQTGRLLSGNDGGGKKTQTVVRAGLIAAARTWEPFGWMSFQDYARRVIEDS